MLTEPAFLVLVLMNIELVLLFFYLQMFRSIATPPKAITNVWAFPPSLEVCWCDRALPCVYDV